VAAFKQMLGNKEIPSTAKWNDVQKQLAKERLWNALKTVGERKQVRLWYQRHTRCRCRGLRGLVSVRMAGLRGVPDEADEGREGGEAAAGGLLLCCVLLWRWPGLTPALPLPPAVPPQVKKARDAFLKMLATCPEIDSRTRWRSTAVRGPRDGSTHSSIPAGFLFMVFVRTSSVRTRGSRPPSSRRYDRRHEMPARRWLTVIILWWCASEG
jgi:hypothetical protein